MNRTKLTYLVLPLVLLGCQVMNPGQLSRGPAADRLASVTLKEQPARPADVPPTVDTTLTAPEAQGAVIATQPEALAQQPPQFGGLVLNVAWPERAIARKTQAIPSTANALWVKVYKGNTYGGAKSAQPAPDSGTVLASRVVGRDANDQIPGATPTPCCGGDTSQPKRASLYISLPPGDVTVWVGTFAEVPENVATNSAFLSSAQTTATIQANRMGAPKPMTLGPNPQIAPNVTAAVPAYVGPGGSFVIKGGNFDDEDLKALLYIAPPAGQSCCATKTPLTVTAHGTDSLTVTVPKDASSQTYLVQVEAKGFAITSSVEVGILNKDNPFALSLEGNAKEYYPTGGKEYALPPGGKLTVTGLSGRVGCCSQDGPAMPLSMVSVVPPGGATASLDASGSYVLPGIGQYKIVAASGEAKLTQKINAFRVKVSLDTSEWDGGQSRDSFAFPVATLVSPPCPTCNYDFPTKLYYFIRDGFFVDAQDNQLPIGGYQAGDFTYASDTLTLNTSNRTITGGSGTGGVVTAMLKASGAVTATASARIYQPTSVKLTADWTFTPYPGNGFNYSARLVYAYGTDTTKPELGKDSDFEWTSSNTAVATINAESGEGQITQGATAGASTTVTATLRNDPTRKATVVITIPTQ
ncbi:MAG: hypothetical protein FJZ01_24160 [Candidatus Sericytochromatia bacterium]|nr:hypothetical protein [Candidatus Tanganyikabacteria bacterium]